jgi:hypothetical protein
MVLLFPLYFVAAQVSTMSPYCKLFVGAKMDSMAYHPWLVESIRQWWARITVTYFHVKINSKEDFLFYFAFFLFFILSSQFFLILSFNIYLILNFSYYYNLKQKSQYLIYI